jgi:hypothetical protein
MTTRIGVLALLLTLFLAAGRTVLAARDSLGIGGGNGVRMNPRGGDATLDASRHLDSLLASCAIGVGRDPFRPGTVPLPIGARPAPTAPAEPVVTPPRVAVFMQDGNSVIVQIEVDGATSPRLGVGGTFRGWTIAGISGRTISVTKDGKSYTINRP